MSDPVVVRVGGNVLGGPPDNLNIQLTYQLPVEQVGSLGLTIRGVAELNNAIAGFYELTGNQPQNTRAIYARFWADSIISQLSSVIVAGAFNLNVNINGNLVSITPNFRYREVIQGFIKIVPATFLPKYVEAESSGYIQFTPEFNIPTTFDNANFIRAEDDNYTNHISEFINSPQFNLALHIRPKIKLNSKNKKCDRCRQYHNKCKPQKITNTSALKALVIFLYQTCLSIQREKISVKDGVKLIKEKIAMFDKYQTGGEGTFSFNVFDNDFIELILCRRYRLKNTDCIVGFTLQGVNDIFNDQEGAEFNQIIMNASSVPIDEDMSDAIFPSNTGLFVYTNQ